MPDFWDLLIFVGLALIGFGLYQYDPRMAASIGGVIVFSLGLLGASRNDAPVVPKAEGDRGNLQ